MIKLNQDQDGLLWRSPRLTLIKTNHLINVKQSSTSTSLKLPFNKDLEHSSLVFKADRREIQEEFSKIILAASIQCAVCEERKVPYKTQVARHRHFVPLRTLWKVRKLCHKQINSHCWCAFPELTFPSLMENVRSNDSYITISTNFQAKHNFSTRWV